VIDVLGDAHRRLVLGLAITALLALMAGNTLYTMQVPPPWDAAMADPARWDGQEVLLPLFTVDVIDGPDRYVLRRGTWTIPIQGSTADLHVGGDLSVRGRFDADVPVVVEEWRELAPGRVGKRRLGIGAIFVLIALWPSLFATRDGRLVSRA
jgi:hypothetical protein